MYLKSKKCTFYAAALDFTFDLLLQNYRIVILIYNPNNFIHWYCCHSKYTDL